MKTLTAALVALLLASGVARAQRATAQAMEEALLAGHPEEAEALYERLPEAQRRSAAIEAARAELLFHRANYVGAVAAIERSLAAEPAGPASRDVREQRRQLYASTQETLARYEVARSADGRYEVYHAPGRDALLVPYALETLRAADERLFEDLGARHPGPIRLVFVPAAQVLSDISSLPFTAIETSGTVALAKYDRLMITSPRGLVGGYPWRDTITHELTHLVLTRATRNRAPVWVQEGIARFLERRWREDEPRVVLPAAIEGLVARAIRDDGLIPFERLHPSIALLPSQAEASLAFAQVSTFFEHIHGRYGRESLPGIVGALADGQDARAAVSAVTRTPFARVERSWKRALARRPAPDGVRFRARQLRRADAADETAEVNETARRHLRLGDLLWDRNRPRAAAVEYRRALAAAPDDPVVAARAGRAALVGGDPQGAIDALAEQVVRSPEHADTWAVLGAAHAALGHETRAREAAENALSLNPFDPRPHCVLARFGRDTARLREAETCRALGGAAIGPPSDSTPTGEGPGADLGAPR